MNLLDLVKLVQADLRPKSAISGGVALIAYLLWFQNLQEMERWAAAVLVFLGVWLLLTATLSLRTVLLARKRAEQAERNRLEHMHDALASLTQWQREFLRERVNAGQRQIHAHEIGGYRAVWGPEVAGLVQKRIMTDRFNDAYEIAPNYWNYVGDHWDVETWSPRSYLTQPQ